MSDDLCEVCGKNKYNGFHSRSDAIECAHIGHKIIGEAMEKHLIKEQQTTTPKPTLENHNSYCEKDFCKYGEPDCPVIVRSAKPTLDERRDALAPEHVNALVPNNIEFRYKCYSQDAFKAGWDACRAEMQAENLKISSSLIFLRERHDEVLNEIKKLQSENRSLVKRIADLSFHNAEKIKKILEEK